jgi:hypothetical protein
MTIPTRSVIGVLFLVGIGAAAEAQQALSLEQMALLVKTGDTVTVADASGRETRGRIGVLSPTSLTLLIPNSQSVTFAAAEIDTIRQRRSDSLGNGAQVGFWSGAAFGVTVAAIGVAEDDYLSLSPVWIPVVAAFYGGIGAAIGVGVDAVITGEHVIYARPAAPRAVVRVSPMISTRQRGVRVSVHF